MLGIIRESDIICTLSLRKRFKELREWRARTDAETRNLFKRFLSHKVVLWNFSFQWTITKVDSPWQFNTLKSLQNHSSSENAEIPTTSKDRFQPSPEPVILVSESCGYLDLRKSAFLAESVSRDLLRIMRTWIDPLSTFTAALSSIKIRAV